MNDTIFDIDTCLPMPFGLVIFTTLLGLGWVLPRVLALISCPIKECSPPSTSEAFVTRPIFVMKRTNSHFENRRMRAEKEKEFAALIRLSPSYWMFTFEGKAACARVLSEWCNIRGPTLATEMSALL
jgi:hypothetical protein